MVRHVRRDRPASITSLPESPAEELDRRQKRYAVMAAIFVASFTAAAVLHRYTVVALVLCAIAITTLVLSVVGANVRTPRRPNRPAGVVNDQTQVRPPKD